jgi:hypothetical protein
MKTRKVNTRFMTGNIDVECVIYDIMANTYGMMVICECGIDFEDAIYSDGFIYAIESGLIPELEIVKNYDKRGDQEYHHLIINDECFRMYFN